MKTVIICDIDGTASNPAHRRHLVEGEKKNFDAFYALCGDDPPNEDIRQLLGALPPSYSVHYITGRPEPYRYVTETWLAFNGFPYFYRCVHMRAAGDHREDHVIKEEILDRDLKLTPREVLFVLDDRDQVVRMWRRRGFRVLQVADGDY